MTDFIGIIFLLLAAAAIGLAYFINSKGRQGCLSLRLEGIRVNRLTRQLLFDLQQHRGMASACLGGDRSFGPRLEQKQAGIERDMAELDVAAPNVSRAQGLMTVPRWEDIRSDWQALRREVLTLTSAESFRRHSMLIRAVLYSMGDVAERSQIGGTCAADAVLVNALWSKLPVAAEGLGQARAIGSSVAAQGYCSGVA